MTHHLNKLFIALLMLISLSACTTQPIIPDVQIPAALVQDCRPLEQLTGMTGKDLITNITDNAAIYFECADAKHALNQAVQAKK